MKNNGISSSYNTEIESGFYVLRFKNDTERIIRKKHPVNQDVIQFHFCLKGQTNFSFNNGNYSFQVREEHSMLLYNPQKPIPINVCILTLKLVLSSNSFAILKYSVI